MNEQTTTHCFDQKPYLLIGFLCIASWIGLWFLAQHEVHSQIVSRHLSISGMSSSLALFLGWVFMIVAMMLPTTLPLISIFSRMIRTRSHGVTLQALLIIGYLTPWSLSGLVFVTGHYWTLTVLGQFSHISEVKWMLGPAILIAAGAYQFSAMKYACLKQCRTPLSFVMRHWHGKNEYREAYRLGAAHGLFCLGCCWLLMLTMTVTGIHHLGWMFFLGIAMAIEKNILRGALITKPLGALFIGWGLVMIIQNGLSTSG